MRFFPSCWAAQRPAALIGAIASVFAPVFTLGFTLGLSGGSALAQPVAPPASGPAPAVTAAEPAAQKPPIATDVFAKLPLLTDVALSPDGLHLAALMNVEDKTALVVRPVDGDKLRSLMYTDNQVFHFRWIEWVGNDHVLASVRFASRRGHVPTVETRLLSLNVRTGKSVELVPASPFRTESFSQVQDAVVDWLPEDGRHVLLQLSEGRPGSTGVYKINVENGRRVLVQPPLNDVNVWITDAEHRVRVAVRAVDGKYTVLARDAEGGSWRTLWSFQAFSRDAAWPLGFGRNPQELYILALHDGRQAVYTVDLASPRLERTLRLAHPAGDIGGSLLRSPTTGEVIGIRSGGLDQGGQTRTDLWDPGWRALAAGIDKGLPKRRNRLLGFSQDGQRYLLQSSGNGIPGQYYLGDRRSGELMLLADQHADLPVDRLVGKKLVRIRTRDGLELVAYLSTPASPRSAAGSSPRWPLVLLPHGGPHARDDADFDIETEFLTSRGYAVLQVNFRGSAGFGHDFMVAGLQRWGLSMQDDLTDAVQWAINAAVADPKRIAIVGASYGGYAALMGLVKTPQLYRCGVSFAGVTDLIDLVQHQSDYVGGEALAQAQVGHAWNDRERLKATSPARQAERIQAPVLLVHGSADRSVPVAQSRDMARALQRAGKPHRYIEQADGDHHLSLFSHRLAYFQALEAFLAEHLAPAP